MNVSDSFPTLSNSLAIFGLTLFHSLWQGMVIGIVCGLMLKMMHRKMASLRFTVAYISLLLLFFAFVGTFYGQYHTFSATTPDIAFDEIAFDKFDKEIIPSPSTVSSQENWWAEVAVFYQKLSQKFIVHAPFIVACWLLGFFYYAIGLTAGLYQVRQMKRRSHMPEERWVSMLQHLQNKIKIQRRIQLLISSEANIPFTLGWLKPVILLPPSIFTELSADQLETILVHELAHIKRHDYLLNIIQAIIEVFLFFNPIYWYIANILEKEREQACDQITLNTLPHPMIYARALTRLAELNCPSFSQDVTISAIGKQYLQQRIRNIIQHASYTSIRSKQAVFKWYQLITIVALGLLFTILTLDVQGNKQLELSTSAVNPGFVISEQVTDQEKDQNVLSANANVVGKVIDAQTGEPLKDVSIIIKNKKAGTVTYSNGKFTIQANLDKDTLTFEFPGYQTVQTTIHFTSVNIALQKTDYHPLPPMDNKGILYIIDQISSVVVSAPADAFLNRKL